MLRFIYFSFLALTVLSSSVNAKGNWNKNFELEPLIKNKDWEMSAEVGVLFTSGNTDSSSLLGKISAKHEWHEWAFKYKFNALFKQSEKFDKAQDKEVLKTTAERYLLELESKYQVTDTSSAFVFYSYNDDRFAPFVEYTTLVGGYNFRALETSDMYLDLNIGPGYARGLTSDDELEKGMTLRASVAYQWNISDTAKFINNVSINTARFNTRTVAESYLTTKITGSMQMKVGMKATHNTEVRNDREKLDTETSLTLVVNI